MTIPFYVPPEQVMKDRAEYARKGIAKGRSIATLEYADGILLLAENPSGALHKIGEIYDRIAFAGVGKYNEFEALRVAGVRLADIKGYTYGRSDVTAKGLANAYSQSLGAMFTEQLKPYETEILVVELGETDEDNRMFEISYDGTLEDKRRFCAIGGKEEELSKALGERYQPGMTLAEAVRMTCEVFEMVEKRKIPLEGWEAAVLDRSNGRRSFRRLSQDQLRQLRES